MQMNEAEDMKKERKESFKTVSVAFKQGPLNFDFAFRKRMVKNLTTFHFLFLKKWTNFDNLNFDGCMRSIH
jgi:hypothetical protein